MDSNARQAPMRRSTTLAFNGFNADFDRDEVEGFFSQFGRVVGAHVKYTPYETASASGFVSFATQESVDKALALHGTEVLRRTMSIHALFELPDTIEVAPLPLGVEPDRVKALFSSCGEVVDVMLLSSLASVGRGHCYGYVRFASPVSVTTALKMRTKFAGRSLGISRAIQREGDLSIWDEHAVNVNIQARTVNIYGIPPQVTEVQLQAEFESCGEIETTRIWRVPTTGNPVGYGFIKFVSPASAEKALEVSKELAGHRLQITRSRPIRPSVLDYVHESGGSNPNSTTSLRVGRLFQDMDSQRLRREFERFGKVASAVIARNRDTGQSLSYGYVNFASPQSVELAMRHKYDFKIDGFSLQLQRGRMGSAPKRPRNVAHVRNSANNHQDADSWEYDY